MAITGEYRRHFEGNSHGADVIMLLNAGANILRECHKVRHSEIFFVLLFLMTNMNKMGSYDQICYQLKAYIIGNAMA